MCVCGECKTCQIRACQASMRQAGRDCLAMRKRRIVQSADQIKYGELYSIMTQIGEYRSTLTLFDRWPRGD